MNFILLHQPRIDGWLPNHTRELCGIFALLKSEVQTDVFRYAQCHSYLRHSLILRKRVMMPLPGVALWWMCSPSRNDNFSCSIGLFFYHGLRCFCVDCSSLQRPPGIYWLLYASSSSSSSSSSFIIIIIIIIHYHHHHHHHHHHQHHKKQGPGLRSSIGRTVRTTIPSYFI